MKKAKLIRLTQITMATAAMATVCWIGYSVILFLTTSPRFEVKKLSVSGLKRVKENEVIAQAGFEVGTNVFRVSLEEMRGRIEDLQWVRHAMVERVLPDQIIIKIIEREPVGLARVNGEVFQFDIDAKILDPDDTGNASFPILDGLRADDSKGNLLKVDAYRKVLDDLGEGSLSQVHVSDTAEVTVVSASDPLIVNLGTTEFRNRWIKYLQLKPQIQQQYPSAVRVDLRFKNQVIVRMRDDGTGENIVWDEEKRTL